MMGRIVLLIAVMATAILSLGVTFFGAEGTAAAETTYATNIADAGLPSGNIDATPASHTPAAGTSTQSDPVLVGAGDIASCSSSGDEATAALLDGISGTVFTTGDNVYETGTASEFANCYAPSWGRHKARTRPSAGNHEYETAGASGYFGYFGAAAGDPLKGYYSYDLGTWHVVVLNSNCAEVGGCDTTSAQGQWLQGDLAAHSNAACTLAYFHHPLFSSGSDNGNDPEMRPIWDSLYAAGAEMVLNGHDHDYERFAPQTPQGAADPAQGIREFVVGTGGRSHRPFGAVQPNSEVRNADTYGVLKLTLHPGSYEWQFVPEAGKTFTDSGTGECHGPTPTPSPAPTSSPTPSPTPTPTPSPTPSPTPEPQNRDKGPLAGGTAFGKDVLVPGDVIDILPDGTKVVGIDQITTKTENCELTAHGDDLTMTMSDQGVPFRIRDGQNVDITIRPDGTIVANGRMTLGDEFPVGLRDNPTRLVVPIPVDPENDTFPSEPNSKFPIISSTGIDGQGCHAAGAADTGGNNSINDGITNPGDTSSRDDVIPNTTSDKQLPNTGGVPLFGLVALGLFFACAGLLLLRSTTRRST